MWKHPITGVNITPPVGKKNYGDHNSCWRCELWLPGSYIPNDETKLTEVEITHRVPVLTETNDLGGELRREKERLEKMRLEQEEKEKQERLEQEEKERQERLEREELEKKRKYEESLRTRTERGEKIEFTPEQLHEIVNNTPEGQRLLQEQKQRHEEVIEVAGSVAKEDSRVASLADMVDEGLAVETSNEGGMDSSV